MKRILLFVVVMCVSIISLAELPNLDDMDIREQIDVRSFLAGNDSAVGTMYYIIDRSTGICFVTLLMHSGEGNGATLVDCDKLKKNPIMKKYIETGKVD